MGMGRAGHGGVRRAWGWSAALLAAIALTPGWAAAAPKLTVAAPRVEVGELVGGDAADAEFALENTGDEPLKINQVIASCNCTTTSYPQSLQPGEKGVLKAKLTSAPEWDGPVEKHLTLLSNDPAQPSVKLQIVARIRPVFRIDPKSPFSAKPKPGEVVRQVFTITAATDPPFEVTGVQPGGPGVEARLLPADGAPQAGVWRVEVTLRPPSSGDFFGFVHLSTTHPKVPSLSLMVNALSDGITVSPPTVYLGGIGVGAAGPDPVALLILFKREGNFRVLSVQPDNPALKAEVRSGLPGPDGQPAPANAGSNFFQISLQYLGGFQKGKTSGKIVITTDDPASPKLEVPYEAMIDPS